MSQQLQNFLRGPGVTLGAGAHVGLKPLFKAFRANLPTAERTRWTRTLLVAELVKLGYQIGRGAAGEAVLIGVGLPLSVKENGRLCVA